MFNALNLLVWLNSQIDRLYCSSLIISRVVKQLETDWLPSTVVKVKLWHQTIPFQCLLFFIILDFRQDNIPKSLSITKLGEVLDLILLRVFGIRKGSKLRFLLKSKIYKILQSFVFA
jgi:hypothetical protein